MRLKKYRPSLNNNYLIINFDRGVLSLSGKWDGFGVGEIFLPQADEPVEEYLLLEVPPVPVFVEFCSDGL